MPSSVLDDVTAIATGVSTMGVKCGSFKSAILAAVIGLGAGFALVRPANAWEEGGESYGYGGVHGWGGLYRENHGVGYFPEYVYIGPRYLWQPAAYYVEYPAYYVAPLYYHRPGHVVVRHCAPGRPARPRCACR